MALNSNDPRPAYLQVADLLRAQIRTGVLKPGDQLPAGRELSEQYSIASMTVRQALRVLVDEGVVVSRQGKGVFVRSDVSNPAQSLIVDNQVLAELRTIRQEISVLTQRVSALEAQR